MTYKEAREYLIPIAANCVLPQYAAALEKSMEALEKAMQALEGEAQLLADLCSSSDRCKFCLHANKPRHCDGSDYFCHECFRDDCICRNCKNGSKWSWLDVKNR